MTADALRKNFGTFPVEVLAAVQMICNHRAMVREERGSDVVPGSSTFRLANQVMKGRLAERLRAHRSAGRSFEEISRLLHQEAGISVSAKTLGAWVRRLGIDSGEAA